MVLSFFSQFISPVLFGLPLVWLAITLPGVLFPRPSDRWIDNRFATIQSWFVNRFVYQLLTPLDPKGHKWAPILSCILIMLLSINLLGLLPYTYTPTTQLSMNLGFAIPLWLATVLIGFRSDPTASFAHYLPQGTPPLLVPVLIIIETISIAIRPIALGVRLTANLTAGHLLIHLIATGALVIIPILPPVGLLTSLVLLLLTVLETAVAIIQAYVFVLLLSLYLQENV